MLGLDLFFVSLGLILVAFFVSLGSFINMLIVMENLNVLLLFTSLLTQTSEARMIFIVLLIIMTLEVSFGLIILCRLWSTSSLINTVSL